MSSARSPFQHDIEEFNGEVKNAQASYNIIAEFIISINKANSILYSQTQTRKNIIDEIKLLLNEKSETDVSFYTRDKAVKLISKYKEDLAKLQNGYSEFEKSIITELNKQKVLKEEASKNVELAKISILKKSSTALKDKLILLQDSLKSIFEKADIINEDAVKQSGDAKKSYDKINDQSKTIIENDYYKAIDQFLNNYRIILPVCSFTYSQQISCPDADTLLATVKISLIDTSKSLQPAKEFKFIMPVGGGFRTFSSTNLMFSFGGAIDQTAYFINDSIVHTTSGRGNALPSLAFAQNFFWNWKNCKLPRAGFSLGLSANFASLNSLQDVRFFIGPSVILGRNSKVIITSGITGGWNTRLKGRFEEGSKINAAILQAENNQLTEQVFRIGGFTIGIGYKIF